MFFVPDVVKASEYYCDVLGFTPQEPYGDPPCFNFVRRDRVEIMFKLAPSPDLVRPNGAHDAWDAYIWVDDLALIRDELRRRGANIISETPRTFYGCSELDVVDCNGYRLCFAQDVSQSQPAS